MVGLYESCFKSELRVTEVAEKSLSRLLLIFIFMFFSFRVHRRVTAMEKTLIPYCAIQMALEFVLVEAYKQSTTINKCL